MSYDFNIDEILTMAEKIERNGAEFYRKSAENVSDASHRDLLLELALMEDQHEKTFAALRANLSENEIKSNLYDPNDETALYLASLADIRVFFKKEINTTSKEEILKEAIMAEKDSIVFYLGMKKFVPEKMGKDKIEDIINEEMSHITLLSNKLKEVNISA